MTVLPEIIQGFFTDRLARQRQASPNTIAGYRDTIRMLLQFTAAATGKPPVALDIPDLDVQMITAFLTHLESVRGNAVTTRNTRLAAVKSLFRYAYLHAPQHAATIARVLDIPPKRADRAIVGYLTATETQALIGAPDPATWNGRRDHALLALATQTGLRASELTGLLIADIRLGPGAHVACHGKGRKDRITPITRPVAKTLTVWLAERAGTASDIAFPSRRGTRMSTDALHALVAKHATTGSKTCPTLTGRRITPHMLRHTAAMALLHAGVDTTVIALWLGHEQTDTTLVYLAADLTHKQQALDRVRRPGEKPGRYRPPDTLLAFLDNL